MNSALINLRLKILRDKNIPTERIGKVFNLMALDSFCVNELQFDFSKLLSEKLFMQKYADMYKLETVEQARPVIIKRCDKCGAELNAQGLCWQCDIDIILRGEINT